jgi:hypothetical protein
VRERDYQAQLIQRIERRFPGAVVLKNDTAYLQGVPDLLILYCEFWAMLEVKTSANAPSRPNQDYYIDLFHSMSFAAYIWPEIEEAVLSELQHTFRFGR